MDVVDPEPVQGLLGRFPHFGLDILLALRHHLLDPSGMDPPVLDEPRQREAGHLAADRVVARKHHGFRCVVDDHVDSGGLLEGADIAALAADDPALHFVGGELDDRHGELGGLVGGHPLDRHRDHALALPVRGALRFLLDLAQAVGGLRPRLVDHVGHEPGLRLVGGYSRDRFEPGAGVCESPHHVGAPLGDLALPFLQRPGLVLQRTRPLIERILPAVELVGLAVGCLDALLQTMLTALDFFAAVALFLLPGLPEAEPRLLGLQFGGAAQAGGFLFRPLADARRFVSPGFRFLALPCPLPTPAQEVCHDCGNSRTGRQGQTQRIHVFSPRPNHVRPSNSTLATRSAEPDPGSRLRLLR